LANVSGPFTLPTLAKAFASKLPTQLSPSGDWPTEASQIADACILEEIEHLRSLASAVPENKSVPIVDDNLKRLAGFMTTKKIEIPQV
jgi:hypothetical protein